MLRYHQNTAGSVSLTIAQPGDSSPIRGINNDDTRRMKVIINYPIKEAKIGKNFIMLRNNENHELRIAYCVRPSHYMAALL